jgi:peroxiredoxin
MKTSEIVVRLWNETSSEMEGVQTTCLSLDLQFLNSKIEKLGEMT